MKIKSQLYYFIPLCNKIIHILYNIFLCLTKNHLNHFSYNHPEALVYGKAYHNLAEKMVNQSKLLIGSKNISLHKDSKNFHDDLITLLYFIIKFQFYFYLRL